MPKKVILMLFLTSLLLSCAVDQQINLNNDGSGTVESGVYLESFFLTTLQDLTDLNNSGTNGGNRLEADSIAAEMAQNPFFSDIRVESPSEGQYTGSLKFNHIEELFLSAGGSPENRILEYSDLGGGEKQLDIRINYDNFNQIFQLFPMLQDPGFQYFLPERSISEAEYTDMLLFLFEDSEGISERALKSLIRTASLKLLISVDGTITEQQGGQKLNDSTMRISLPLVKLLLHKEEISYSLRYRI
ncbi:MAG: hypothetical protein PQJ58_20865 [Spirochaetales bacterium]|nr:hypothetical protein [Spirochaetales bacterium]